MARQIVEREIKLGRDLSVLRVESGVAASGIPHIGSLGEVARNYAVALALEEQGYKTEFIVFSDNKDGLRSVPKGLPSWLKDYIGYPVMDIPDPFKCHKSYGEHMISLLLESLEKCGFEFKFITAVEAYESGLLTDEIETILRNAVKVSSIIKEETGQEKYESVLPYFPVCGSCGRIYTTKAYSFIPEEKKVLYVCEGMEIKGRWLDGCGYKGEADYSKGEGKLSWKAGEFAARWKALKIRFEAYGKDIADSVRVNDRISREVLGFEPPLHAQYEMFLDKSGRKISKSIGNVFTPQVWFRYGSPQSLLLLMLKRFTGTRNISVTDIPQYMSELDELEDIYFGRKVITDEKERAKLTGLYKYVWLMKPPQKPGIHVPYNLLTYLAKVAPEGKEKEFILEKLRNYGFKNLKLSEDLDRRIRYAINWVHDFPEIKETSIKLKKEEATAIRDLIQSLKVVDGADRIQNLIFEVARRNGLSPKRFFKVIYTILLGMPQGPRLGPYITAMGKQNVIESLRRSLEKSD
ncbi:lysine--tRNA ligase [Candidatus Bathyarchaeota archaeon]|nr:MAG: lysine--tRNA ligase [Candidatus Bathyarchaeota archaeon]